MINKFAVASIAFVGGLVTSAYIHAKVVSCLFTPEEVGEIAARKIERFIYGPDPVRVPWSVKNARPVLDIDAVVVETREQAEMVISELRAVIDKYGFATLNDLCALVGAQESFDYERSGWKNLDGGFVGEVFVGKDQYRVILPSTIFLGIELTKT